MDSLRGQGRFQIVGMLVGFEAGNLVVVGGLHRQTPTSAVKVAGQGVEADDGPVVLESVQMVRYGEGES